MGPKVPWACPAVTLRCDALIYDIPFLSSHTTILVYFARVHAEGTTEAAVSGSRKASTLTGDRRITATSVGCSRVQSSLWSQLEKQKHCSALTSSGGPEPGQRLRSELTEGLTCKTDTMAWALYILCLRREMKGSSAEERRERPTVRSRWDAVGTPSAAQVNRNCCKCEEILLLPAEITCRRPMIS